MPDKVTGMWSGLKRFVRGELAGLKLPQMWQPSVANPAKGMIIDAQKALSCPTEAAHSTAPRRATMPTR
jgi:hypothetical protein